MIHLCDYGFCGDDDDDGNRYDDGDEDDDDETDQKMIQMQPWRL